VTATRAYLHQRQTAELRWMGETSAYFLATGAQTAETFTLVDDQAQRGESVPLHLHRDDPESFYVLEGEITIYLDEQPGARRARARSRTYPVDTCTASASNRKRRATSF
jgi:quercetin dioxygenase-like cupin family protein